MGLTDALPLGRNRTWGVQAKGETYTRETFPIAFPRLIDAGYLRTMKIPLRAGRDFTAHDNAGSQKVMIVNETMARRLWPDRDAVGQVALIGREEWQVVGVFGDVRHGAMDRQSGMEMYLPMAQNRDWSAMDLVVRAGVPVESLVASIQGALRSFDAELPVGNFHPLEQIVDGGIAQTICDLLLGAFSGLALILAALGIYGVISYSVRQRTNEIGIRMALGAPAAHVQRQIVGQTLLLTAIELSPAARRRRYSPAGWKGCCST